MHGKTRCVCDEMCLHLDSKRHLQKCIRRLDFLDLSKGDVIANQAILALVVSSQNHIEIGSCLSQSFVAIVCLSETQSQMSMLITTHARITD